MSWDFISTSYPRAAKPHGCAECHRVIPIGEKHVYTCGRFEGDFMAYRMCSECSDIADAWCDALDCGEGFPLGELRQSLADEGIEDVPAFVADYKARRLVAQTEARRRDAVKAGRQRAVMDITDERIRHVEHLGYDLSHDDEHVDGSLSRAAACYAAPDAIEWGTWISRARRALKWPWERRNWKPKSRRENLVRAGALIVAEIERLDRASAPKSDTL
jgi:hypothetical protein